MSDRRTSTPSRLTKAERKEQARRERVELQRKMARARRTRTIVIAVIAVIAIGVTAFAVTRPQPAPVGPQALLAQAAAAKKAAGCGPVQQTPPYQPASSDREHIGIGQDMPPLSSYTTVPPTSGPHNPTPLGAGVYPTAPPIDRLIHSLEHGAAIVWYAPDAPTAVIDKITTFYRDNATAGSRVIVAPYDYPDQGDAGHLPTGTQMSLVAWHELENCVHPSLPAAFDFTARYAFPSFGQQRYLGKAPEPGGTM